MLEKLKQCSLFIGLCQLDIIIILFSERFEIMMEAMEEPQSPQKQEELLDYKLGFKCG